MATKMLIFQKLSPKLTVFPPRSLQVGDPRYTAFDINDRGNRIYLKYEPSQPTIFPTQETREAIQ